MHTSIERNHILIGLLLFTVPLLMTSCKSSTSTMTNTGYTATYLVSDTAGFGAGRTDPNLLNPWGIAIGTDGSLWLATNHDSAALNYSNSGQSMAASISIPSADHATGGSPSGAVANTTSDFNGAKLLFATEDGIVAAWSNGASAQRVTQFADSEEFKGIAIARDGGANFLYLTDFNEDKIIVLDKNFMPVSGKTLTDPSIPSGISGFGPFGIATINGMLYVTYAHHKPFPDNGDDLAGAGSGYVDVYNPNGTLVKHFATGGTLNSPWGIALAPSGFGQFKNAILIGNFGDGAINAFDSSGAFLGQLSDANNSPIKIDGLWGISFNPVAGDPNTLYFTAGPDEESHGAFGTVK
jgi:uncharacterized protein (TIGR03118 family)